MGALKDIKCQLISTVQSQMGDLSNVDAVELGEVIDMIKDIAECEYYCEITNAMKGGNDEDYDYYDDVMPYTSRNRYGYMSSTRNKTYPKDRESYYYDDLEGRSPAIRRVYMQTKDQNLKMRELENYMRELSSDITEMIEGATEEEKQVLRQKLTNLSTMIK